MKRRKRSIRRIASSICTMPIPRPVHSLSYKLPLIHKYTMNDRSKYDCPVYNLSYDPDVNIDRAILRGYVFSLSDIAKIEREREKYNFYSFNKQPLKRQERISSSIGGW